MGEFRVEEGTALARYATYRSRQTAQPVATARAGERRPWAFVANEVIVNGRERDLIGELERLGGRLVEEPPLPPRPEHIERRREPDMSGAPTTVIVRFEETPRADVLGEGWPESGDLTVSSEMGAQVVSVVDVLRWRGYRIGLNVVGEPFALPLQAPAEGSGLVFGSDPTQWQAFGGRSRVADAWQLTESVRQIRGGPVMWVAICDQGFWVDGAGKPQVAPGQAASDFGLGVLQWNLDNEGSPLPMATSFHGNQVAATAAVGNVLGAAGSGGTIARPAFFHAARTAERAMRAARICVWWGLDIVNYSWGFWGQSEFWFDSDTWDDTFNWAADNGLVVIAAAGNSNLDLPDDENIRPATRTPRTLTVGALNPDGTKRANSNHGSSVDLWAPGSNVEVAPDGGALAGSQVSGTSFAAPIVAGVAAMMLYCNPGLSADDVRRLLVESAWPGTGLVTRGLDAYQAVWAALQRSLPDTSEPNNTPDKASPLLPVGPGGALSPGSGGLTALASAADRDYWSFTISRLSTVTVTAEWYQRIANVFLDVEPVDDVAGDIDLTPSSGVGTRSLNGLLPAGTYRVRVNGTGPTAYRLVLRIDEANLGPDAFEPNDLFDTATRLAFEATHTFPLVLALLARWGPGTYPATLHPQSAILGWTFVNNDYFQFDVPRRTVFKIPRIEIFDTDEPLDVTLYDAGRAVIASWSGVHSVTIEPPPETHCYLVVSSLRQSRYWLRIGLSVDSDALPGPIQEELHIGPKWWGDPPPLALVSLITHLALEIAHEELEDSVLAYAVRPGVQLDLLTFEGEQIRGARLVGAGDVGEALGAAAVTDAGTVTLVIDVDGLEPGAYLLRATLPDDVAAAEEPPRSARSRIGPPSKRFRLLRCVCDAPASR